MHIAYSSVLNSSAVFAGGPWYCAQGSLTLAESACMYDIASAPNVPQLVSLTAEAAVREMIH